MPQRVQGDKQICANIIHATQISLNNLILNSTHNGAVPILNINAMHEDIPFIHSKILLMVWSHSVWLMNPNQAATLEWADKGVTPVCPYNTGYEKLKTKHWK